MRYCSFQHQSLLPSPVTSTAGCCFHFGSVSSFFPELVLHWFPVIGHLSTWVVPFSVFYLFAFSYCSWGSQSMDTEVVCLSLLQSRKSKMMLVLFLRNLSGENTNNKSTDSSFYAALMSVYIEHNTVCVYINIYIYMHVILKWTFRGGLLNTVFFFLFLFPLPSYPSFFNEKKS